MDDREKRKGRPDQAGAEDGQVASAEPNAREAEPEAPEAEASAAAEPEPSEADLLRQQLGDLQGRLRTVSKAYADLQAEIKAYRERADAQLRINKERQSFELVRAFFEPVMNLKRSMQAHGNDMALLLEGLHMIHQQFLSALEQLGLQKVPGEGAAFDPHLHEALAVQPVDDPAQDGKVLMVHSDGYAVNGKVLQPAQVVIGKHEPPRGEG